jgi:flap endonuclease-1
MTATRGFIEVNRLKRLRKLVGLFEEFRSLPGSEQERVTSLLRQMVSDKDIFSTRSSSNWCLENNLKHIERLINLSDGNAQAVDHYIDDLGDHLPPTGNDAEFFLSSKGYINFSSAAPKSSSDGLQQSSRQPNENSRPRSIIHDPPPACFPEIQPNMTSEYVPSTLTSLYLEYCRSIPQLASLSTPYHDSVPSDPDDASTEYAMTKSQYQLTLDEGKFWERLAGLTEARQDQSITEATLMSLTEKSSLMSDSYQRRSNPPTTQTYNESKEILQAMGVPCLDCGGPFEAEALASSLVINGLADYVASEDTVCWATPNATFTFVLSQPIGRSYI